MEKAVLNHLSKSHIQNFFSHPAMIGGIIRHSFFEFLSRFLNKSSWNVWTSVFNATHCTKHWCFIKHTYSWLLYCNKLFVLYWSLMFKRSSRHFSRNCAIRIWFNFSKMICEFFQKKITIKLVLNVNHQSWVTKNFFYPKLPKMAMNSIFSPFYLTK